LRRSNIEKCSVGFLRSRYDQLTVGREKMEPAGGLAILHGLFQQEGSMRKTILTSVCAAVIGLSALAAASAQTAGAPASSQPSATSSPTATDNGSMGSMNKMKKKSKAKKDTKSDSGAMEKK
jgi:hypothetical protein